MITSQGFALIAELIAAALLIAALTGFTVRRSLPWLVGAYRIHSTPGDRDHSDPLIEPVLAVVKMCDLEGLAD